MHDFKKIKLNERIWFSLQSDKFVFCDKVKHGGGHLTFHFGFKSGSFDLHVTTDAGDHFTIIKISHSNAHELINPILSRIAYEVFQGLSEVKEHEIPIFQQIIIKEVFYNDHFNVELMKLKKRKKVRINKFDDSLNPLINLLKEHFKVKDISFIKFKTLKNAIGFCENSFVIKNEWLGDSVYTFKEVNLDLEEVLSKIFGNEFILLINANIDKALKNEQINSIEVKSVEYDDNKINIFMDYIE